MKKLLSILTALVMLILVPASSLALTGSHEILREYRTIEEMAFEDAMYSKKNDTDFKSVIVVNSNSLDSDGLSASGLIGAAKGLICTIDNSYSHENLDKILNGDTSKTIYFIGGSQVIPEGFKFGYGKQGYNCITLAGRTRVETSYEVAKEIQKLTTVNEIALTNAFKGVPDSVNIAYEARKRSMPVILTRGKSVPFSTNGVKAYAIGGNAVLSESLINQTKAVRLGGRNRYETNEKILNYFRRTGDSYSICLGESKGDNMKIATLTGCLHSSYPVVLVSDNSKKDILYEANNLKYYSVNHAITKRIRAACHNASWGTNVTDAVNTIYKVTGANRNNDFFICTDGSDSYLSGSPDYNHYINNYLIFNNLDSYGNYSDFNILVRKYDKKVFIWNATNTKPTLIK